MTQDPSLAGLLRSFGDQVSAGISVATIGRIESYDHATQKATVKPLVQRQYRDGRADTMPIIADVPVVWPRAGGASLTFPVVRGDTVLVIFADQAIERFLASGRETAPGDLRRHALTDAIAIPGLISFNTGSLSTNNDDVLLTYKGAEIRITGGGEITMKAPTVRIDGDVSVTGDVVAGDISLRNHVHGGILPGGSNTDVPVEGL